MVCKSSRQLLRALLWALAFVSLVAPLALKAQTQREPVGALAGVVLSAHGKPVADATVTIQTSDGLHPHATHTDSDGHFQFARWETGQYDVRAYSNGAFSNWDKRIMIRRKKTTEITLRLPPAPR
ncbi:MAG: carboxypeptidase-like regulatory domain-containing protein [Candidatus Acidiferrales bacterium]